MISNTNSIKVVLQSGKVIQHSITNSIFVVQDLLRQLQQQAPKHQFALYKDSKLLSPNDKIQITFPREEYVVAIKLPIPPTRSSSVKSKKDLSSFQNQMEAFKYLRKLGINEEDLLNANIDPKDKEGYIKNYLFNAKLKREFEYHFKHEKVGKMSREEKKEIIKGFVERHVFDESKQAAFQELPEETADVLSGDIEEFIEAVMNYTEKVKEVI